MYSLYVLRTAMRGATVLPDTAVSDIEIRLQPLPTAFPAVAGFLVAAERRGRVELVEGVRPHHAGPQPGGHVQDQRSLLGPHPGRQAVRRVVGLLQRLGGRTERQDGEHRAEDLLPGDTVRLGDPGENRRREPEALHRQLARRRPALRPFGLADL